MRYKVTFQPKSRLGEVSSLTFTVQAGPHYYGEAIERASRLLTEKLFTSTVENDRKAEE